MADRGDNNFMRYVYRGEEGEIIPWGATHITVAEDCTVIRAWAFRGHRNIVEVICHDRVEKIGKGAFFKCPSLRRVIMPGVKEVDMPFCECKALEYVECGKLEIIKECAFNYCESLLSISLPSARIIKMNAFSYCKSLTGARFGNKLETFEPGAFDFCKSLERIIIPLKDGIITDDDIFMGCENLKHVDLVEGALRKTIAALHLEEWRNDMNDVIDSINQILPNASAGQWDGYNDTGDEGEKARTIRRWIRSVLNKIIHYKAEHYRYVKEGITLLELALWKANLSDNNGCEGEREGVRTTRGSRKRARREFRVTSGADVVIKNVLPFLKLDE